MQPGNELEGKTVFESTNSSTDHMSNLDFMLVRLFAYSKVGIRTLNSSKTRTSY